MDGLAEFMIESLRAEMILRAPLNDETEATEKFLRMKDVPTVDDIERLAQVFNRSARLRSERGLFSNAASAAPQPAGGAGLIRTLDRILFDSSRAGPYATHIKFTALMPLTLLNGLIARTIWLRGWTSGGARKIPASFFRAWYDETVAQAHLQMAADKKKRAA